MSKSVKINWPHPGHEPERRNWRKSFPANTVKGRDWIVDVLSDLADFADHEGIAEIGSELRDARARVDRMLKHDPWPNRYDRSSDGD